jgi:uncharacterized protein YecT (DUF1311 family)
MVKVKYFQFITVIGVVFILTDGQLQAASFNCQKAKAKIEITICNNSRLNEADTRLGTAYSQLRKLLSKSDTKQLKQEQLTWIKNPRTLFCSSRDADCLLNVYETRIAGLNAILKAKQKYGIYEFALSKFIPEGYKILDVVRGHLNRDTQKDFLLILEERSRDNIEEQKRPLLILTKQSNGQLKFEARNDNVVFCRQCGGAMGDPYTRTVIKNGYFTVEHYGGSAWKWTRLITFKYSKKDNEWYLHKDGGVSFHGSEPDKVEETVKTVNDFGQVPFEEFDADD